ncbi:MAG: BolA family protein [Aaplasma endosymbiont of Hyalomma asiaticum]
MLQHVINSFIVMHNGSNESTYHAMATEIKRKINDLMKDSQVHIVNESDDHAGHTSRSGYAVSHLKVTVVSDYFTGMQKLNRQRLMHKVLETEIKMLHSITFVLLTNAETPA